MNMMSFFSPVLNEDYSLPVTLMSFLENDGNGATLMFNVDVNSDNLIECDENILIELVDPSKESVMLDSNIVTTTIIDIDGKNALHNSSLT